MAQTIVTFVYEHVIMETLVKRVGGEAENIEKQTKMQILGKNL